MNSLREIASNFWVIEDAISLGGIHLPLRSVLIRLKNQELLMISPTHPSDALVSEIKKKGHLKHIIAPNVFHHLFVSKMKDFFPESKTYCCAGLEKKKKNFKFDEIIEHTLPSIFENDLDFCLVNTGKFYRELVFFHLESETLILTDLFFNIENSKGLSKLFWKFYLGKNKFGSSKLVKFFLKRSKNPFPLEKISSWDFQRVVMAMEKFFIIKTLRTCFLKGLRTH